MAAEKHFEIPTSRLEAFSDGVIAIIITVMVFDLKLPEQEGGLTSAMAWQSLERLLPRFLSFIGSFVVLAIMWVNHHQLFHQISRTTGRLLWLNIHLLFWMSLVPLGTNFIGANPFIPEATGVYGLIFCMNAIAFALLRSYAFGRGELVHPSILQARAQKTGWKTGTGILLYFAGAVAGYFSVYISLILFAVVPAIYFIPERIAIHAPSE